MKITLAELIIDNFKGISKLHLKFNGSITEIKGANGTCKSSVADAFFWLFDNANSEQRSNFNIIPLDETGTARDRTESTVESILDIDGKTVVLKKTFKQVWTRKRGAEHSELTGHTTDHFFNEVPVSKKDYHGRIAEFISPDKFRTLADIKYFCSAATPQYRRQVLIDLIGSVTDEAIIFQYDELSELPQILNGRSMDDYKTVLNRNLKEINNQLEYIPIRIDEARNGRPKTEHLNAAELTTQAQELDDAISKKRDEIAGLSAAGLIAEKRRELSDLSAQIRDDTLKIHSKYNKRRHALNDRIDEIGRQISLKRTELNIIVERRKGLAKTLYENTAQRKALESEYKAAKAMQFEPKITCYACGQELPPDKIDGQIASFNVEKAEKIRAVNEKGKALFAAFNDMEKQQMDLADQAGMLEGQIDSLNSDLKQAGIDLEYSHDQMVAEIDAKTREAKEGIGAISADLEKTDIDISPARDRLKKELSDLESMKGNVESDILKLTHAEKVDRRISELTLLLKEHGAAYERNLYELNLLGLFQRRRAEFIEDNVSRLFHLTCWKLFEEQINGGYRDICEATYEGIPFSTDLNTGAKINVGIDVINTLSQHYGMYCPVFIDNAESVTTWLDMEHQQIRLIAAADKKELECKPMNG